MSENSFLQSKQPISARVQSGTAPESATRCRTLTSGLRTLRFRLGLVPVGGSKSSHSSISGVPLRRRGSGVKFGAGPENSGRAFAIPWLLTQPVVNAFLEPVWKLGWVAPARPLRVERRTPPDASKSSPIAWAIDLALLLLFVSSPVNATLSQFPNGL